MWEIVSYEVCSGLRSLSAAAVSRFKCLACFRVGGGGGVGVVGEVKPLCNLGDVSQFREVQVY